MRPLTQLASQTLMILSLAATLSAQQTAPDAADTNLFKRSMPSDVSAGNDDVKSHIDYPSADQSVEQAPRGVTTTTDYDEVGRPIHIRSTGKVFACDSIAVAHQHAGNHGFCDALFEA